MPDATTTEPGTAPVVSPARQQRLTELGVAFKHAYRSLSGMRGRETHLADGALGHAQHELLANLRDHGPLSASDLAGAAKLSPATVSQMLDHLAASGYVERIRSETDRRVVVTTLTPVGEGQLTARTELWRARWREALDGIADDELEIAARVLGRVAGVFDQAPPPAA